MRRRTVLLVLAALAAALGAGAALSASPSVTITTPKTNQKVSLHQSPYTAVAGTANFAAATAGTTRFFLRRDGCGTSNDNPHLSVTSGTDAGDGCGLIVDQVGTGRGRRPAGDVHRLPGERRDAARVRRGAAGQRPDLAHGRAGRPGRGRRDARGARRRQRGRRSATASGSAVLDPTAASTPGAVHDPAERLGRRLRRPGARPAREHPRAERVQRLRRR